MLRDLEVKMDCKAEALYFAIDPNFDTCIFFQSQTTYFNMNTNHSLKN